MKVAVIVVNYNDADDTVNYVKKISKYEIIQKIVIVDNLSTEINAIEKLKDLESDKVIVLQSDKNGGYAYGNNFGVQYLEKLEEKYDYLVISNPDVEVTENAIYECLQILSKNDNVAIVAPRMYDLNNKPIRRSSWKKRTFLLDVIHSTRLLELIFYKKLRSGEYSEEEYSQKTLEVEAISGAFFIVKYDVFKEIGMFDENVFLFYEEDILAQKLAEKGYKTISVNSVNFVHFESQTIGKTLSYYKKCKQLYKSKMYYQKKYNKINEFQIFVFGVLNVFRKIELLVEIPIRKILKK